MTDSGLPEQRSAPSPAGFLPEGLLLRELSRRGIGLRFAPALEAAFQEFLSRFFIRQARAICLAAVLLLLGMQAATVWVDSVPAELAKAQAVLLFAVLTPALLIAAYVLRGERGAARLHGTVLVMIAITTVVALLLPSLYAQYGQAYPFRFSEFLLVFVFLLSGLPFNRALQVGVVIVALEAARMLTMEHPGQSWMQFLVLGCFGLVAVAACYLQSRAIRRHFLTEQLYFGRSVQDSLTRLLNRRGWDEAAEKAWSQARRDHCEVGLAVIDIDHFKRYNDVHGHPAGDEVLREVAQCLRSSVARRPFDLVARLGGEEFCVLWYSTAGVSVDHLAERIRDSVEKLGIDHPDGGPLTVSVGYTHLVPRNNVTVNDVYALADSALYAAKLSGRNAVRTTSASVLNAAKIEPGDMNSNSEEVPA